MLWYFGKYNINTKDIRRFLWWYEKGEYETDFITCELWNGVAINTAEYCKQGDILGVKGRIKTDSYENESGEKVYKTSIVAEKVTFLSSKYKESETDNDMEV